MSVDDTNIIDGPESWKRPRKPQVWSEGLRELGPVVPRDHFGLKVPATPDNVAAMQIAREADARQRARIHNLAAEAARAYREKRVCPSLVRSLAERIGGLAQHARTLADECKSYGLTIESNMLSDHAGALETLQASMECEP